MLGILWLSFGLEFVLVVPPIMFRDLSHWRFFPSWWYRSCLGMAMGWVKTGTSELAPIRGRFCSGFSGAGMGSYILAQLRLEAGSGFCCLRPTRSVCNSFTYLSLKRFHAQNLCSSTCTLVAVCIYKNVQVCWALGSNPQPSKNDHEILLYLKIKINANMTHTHHGAGLVSNYNPIMGRLGTGWGAFANQVRFRLRPTHTKPNHCRP